MTTSMIAVLLLTAMHALVGPTVARRVAPAWATRILVPACFLSAAASTFAVGVAALTLIGQLPEIAEEGDWSPAALHADSPVPAAVAGAGVLVLAYIVGSAFALVVRRSVALVGVHRDCTRHGAPGTVVVVESTTPDAFTTPALTGRIIVTRGLLDVLTPAERRAMFAHERSHLRHRHAWWLLAADLAAAINPLFRPTARQLRHTVERWADEDASRVVSDRRVVARAIAQAALAAHQHRTRPEMALGASGSDVPRRVAALLAPAPRWTRPALVVLAASATLLAATVIASVNVQRDGDALFDQVTIVSTGAPGLAATVGE
jgi:peptidase M48-like protein